MSQSTEQKRRRGPTVATLENVPQIDVPKNRGQEILRYLKLFGYKEDGSVLQVHVAGSFSAVSRRPREIAIKEKAAARYKDRTFTVLGRTHDPSILQKLIPPRSKRDASSRPGYLGYLWKEKDVDQKSPHEFIPLDFVPANLRYPTECKSIFDTPAYLITMHVPSDFARYKNEVNNRLRRIRGDVDVKKEWKFLDELSEYGYEARRNEGPEGRKEATP